MHQWAKIKQGLSGMALAMGLLLQAPLSVAQISPDQLLPVDEAFALTLTREGPSLVLHWTIAPGYYLYRHAFKVDSETAGLGTPSLPTGTITTDEFFGQTETYRDEVTMRVPIVDDPRTAFEVLVVSQGCADLGVCYPPHRQRLSVEAVVSTEWVDQLPASAGEAVGRLWIDSAGALPAEEAFGVEAIALDGATVLVRITPSPNYYVYKPSLGFSTDSPDVSVLGFEAPTAQPMVDEYFGQTEVYFDSVEIPVRLSRANALAQTLSLSVDFQGCLKDGICYPPMSRMLSVELPAATMPSAQTPPLQEQDRLAAALAQTPLLALALFLLAGVLLAFTPCVFPMVPILSGLIAGEGETINTGRAFRLSLIYVLSMALVYTAFGVVAGVFGQNLQAVFQHPAVLVSFSVLFVLLSLAMFGFFELQLPSALQTKLNDWSNRQEGGTWIGAAIMGGLSALVVGPCVAPALMGALIYIGQTGDAFMGGAALFSMAIGMGIPLITWGTSAGRWLPRAGGWMNAVKAVFGVGLLALAIWMLERILPPAVVMALWGSLLIGCAVYLGALNRLAPEASGWSKLWQALGVIVLILGVAQWMGALTGGRDWTRPLSHWQRGAELSAPAPMFVEVDTLAQLQQAIDAATQPVFLDFYADWCVDCIRMERRTFIDPAVATRMGDFALIKVDVTDYNEDHQAILAEYGLIGPPAMLFFTDGQELSAERRFGFMAPDIFLTHLDQVMRSAQAMTGPR